MMQVTWRSPSNIALIKYWGKHGNQLPNNASLSLTLHEAYTQTSVELLPKKKETSLEIDFKFEGKRNAAFAKKINTYLSKLANDFPWLKNYKIKIITENSFPHSAGIASSASSMSALALCICSLDLFQEERTIQVKKFYEQASHYARIGSGSASRSVIGEFSVWGNSALVKKANDLYAIKHPIKFHTAFNEIQDTILIVNNEAKSVTSSAGHALMQDHPSAALRYNNAALRMKRILQALQKGNWNVFGKVIEEEALELHALMMTSDPSYILMQPGTLSIIEKIRKFREKTQLPVYFTLDAGPNVHVLYPYYEKKAVRNFIQSELLKFCSTPSPIYDYMGNGPIQVIEE
ncbi:MAG: diphosphomevalonate decarboxylase [Bacteroidetes bacterium]|nr:diphosphomevalonate decarboxylase [Bacteroidota bacterium]MBP8753521.1 diphosphomevalonate decarboxylase [Chitinophagales bacterium]MBK8681008.1 diphosphomevalonate decarboxylase [Bacteroidota bacterium]MBP9188351.1 diphosphomevalonate decarboxylase [Chitinophagales bacterium]MBP9547587.1 diphosphomevalonate decarboxylase [Chitinophagales bacterium]